MEDKVELKDTPYGNSWTKFRPFVFSVCGGGFMAVLFYYSENPSVKQFIRRCILGVVGSIVLIVLAKLVVLLHQRRKLTKKNNEINSQEIKLNSETSINCTTMQSEPVETESKMDQVSRSSTPQNNGKTVRFLGLKTEDLVKRTFSGYDTEVWSEFIDYFENLASDNSWTSERSRRMLLRSFRGEAAKYAFRLPLGWQRDYDRLKDKMDEKFGEAAMKEKYFTEARLRCRQLSDTCDDLDQVVGDLCPSSEKH